MKCVNKIACIDAGDGLYFNCSSKNFATIIPSENCYDHVKVVVDHTNIGGEVDSSFQNPFEDLFKSNIKDIITIVVIIIAVVVAAAISFFILKFLYKNFKGNKERNDRQMTQFPTNASSSVCIIPGGEWRSPV